MCENEKIVRVPDVTREEWLAWRRTGIGGSDAACVMGLNPYRSRLELYADKKGMIPDREDNEAMRLGRDLEQYVADRFCEATGKKVRKNNYMYRSTENPFMIADIDREVVGENAGLECKTTRNFEKNNYEAGNIPLIYYVQCVHYMAVRNYDRMYLGVLVFGKGFYWFTIERNKEEEAALIAQERAFWVLVENDTPPEGDGTESAETACTTICGLEKEEKESDPVDLCDLDTEFHILDILTNEQKDVEKKINEIKEKIKLRMGDAPAGWSMNYTASYKSQTRTTVDSKKLQKEFPQAYAACTKQSTARIFKYKYKEKKDDNQ